MKKMAYEINACDTPANMRLRAEEKRTWRGGKHRENKMVRKQQHESHKWHFATASFEQIADLIITSHHQR